MICSIVSSTLWFAPLMLSSPHSASSSITCSRSFLKRSTLSWCTCDPPPTSSFTAYSACASTYRASAIAFLTLKLSKKPDTPSDTHALSSARALVFPFPLLPSPLFSALMTEKLPPLAPGTPPFHWPFTSTAGTSAPTTLLSLSSCSRSMLPNAPPSSSRGVANSQDNVRLWAPFTSDAASALPSTRLIRNGAATENVMSVAIGTRSYGKLLAITFSISCELLADP
mmetsp:Transcript_42882/g.100829  ORF Transcript_42882/g.100829 Transcript_42882/m.100829 type:complete len:226 (-) Transcript_42882:1123-1800(-)